MLVVLDLDGTLIDSVRDLAVSASELAIVLGGRALETTEVASMVGDGAALLVRRALAAAGVSPETPDALPRFLEIYERRMLETTVAYEGIPETLTALGRHARLAVLTNKPLRFSTAILGALNLSACFESIIGGDGPLPRKPDPAALRSLMSGENRVLMVGDSPVDWATAIAAPCQFAWARYGFGAARFEDRLPDTSYVLEQPTDLLAVADRFSAVMSGL